MSEFLLQLRWTGRFGNRMFQYAYGATYARLTGLEFWIPAEWEGTRLFKWQNHRVVENDDISWWAACLSPTAKVFSPVLDKRHVYGVDGMEEITVVFVEGNHPHYLTGGRYEKPDILLGE